MKKLFSEVLLTALSQAISLVALIGMQVLLARSVTVAEFGLVAASQALVLLVEGALVSRGAETTIQLIGHHWNDGPGVLRAISLRLMRHEIVVSGLGYLAFAAAAIIIGPMVSANGWLAAAMALTILMQFNYGLRRSLFLLHHKVRTQATFEICSAAIQIALAFALIPSFGGPGFAATLVGSALAKNLLAHVWTQPLWREVRASPPAETPEGVEQALRISSLHSVLRNMLSNGATNADVLILGLLGRPETVAVYRVARTLANIPARLTAPAWVVLRPRLLQAYQVDDHGRFCWLVTRAAVLFALAAVILLVGTWWLGAPVLSRLYGPAYTASLSTLLVLMIGAIVFGSVTGWLSFTMIVSSRKSLGTALFAGQLGLIVAGGFLFSQGDPMGMAWVIACCNIATSAIAWAALLAGRFRRQSTP